MDKNREAILIPYSYTPSIMSDRFTADMKEEMIYVLKEKMHPDPLGKMIWGWDINGNMCSDWSKRFTRKGKLIKIPYTVKGCMTAREEDIRRNEAVKAFIKALPK